MNPIFQELSNQLTTTLKEKGYKISTYDYPDILIYLNSTHISIYQDIKHDQIIVDTHNHPNNHTTHTIHYSDPDLEQKILQILQATTP